MAKRSQAGFPDPNEAGGGSPHPDRVGGVFYTSVVRDGQARRTGVRIGHQAKASRADRSFFVADVGQLYLGATMGRPSSNGRSLPDSRDQ